jgi:hypothetical protein
VCGLTARSASWRLVSVTAERLSLCPDCVDKLRGVSSDYWWSVSGRASAPTTKCCSRDTDGSVRTLAVDGYEGHDAKVRPSGCAVAILVGGGLAVDEHDALAGAKRPAALHALRAEQRVAVG